MKDQIHQYFSENKAGIKQNYNHIIRHAKDIYVELQRYSNQHQLICRNLSEIAYLYVNDMISVPMFENQRYKFFRYSKGYHTKWFIDNYDSYPNVIEFIKNDENNKLSSIEQRVMHRHYYAEQINSMFNDFGLSYSKRIKIWMIKNDITHPPKCTECSNHSKPRESTTGFRLTCSDACEVERTMHHRKKWFKLSNNEEVLIMGYEGYVFNKLLLLFNYSDIIYGSKMIKQYIGRILYIYNDVNRKYYPDFFIQSTNTVIEVKSSYTYNVDVMKNNEKAKACIDNGLNFEFWIHDFKLIHQMQKDYTLKTITYENYKQCINN